MDLEPEPKGSTDVTVGSAWRRILMFLQETPASHLTAFGIFVYGVGFVVANVHYGRFGVSSFDLLSGRYVAAGILFAVFSAPFIWAGALLGEAIFRGLEITNPRLRRSDRYSALWAALVLTVLSWVVLVEISVGIIGARGALVSRSAYIIYFAGCAVIMMVLSSLYWKSEGRRRRGHMILVSIAAASISLILPVLFGTFVYPEISAKVGGGAGWLAHPVKWTTAGSTLARNSEIYVVLVDGGTVIGAFCASRDGREPVRIIASLDDLGGLLVKEESSYRAFLGRSNTSKCSPKS